MLTAVMMMSGVNNTLRSEEFREADAFTGRREGEERGVGRRGVVKRSPPCELAGLPRHFCRDSAPDHTAFCLGLSEASPVRAMECLKNCCKNLMRRRHKECETQVINLKVPPITAALTSGEKRRPSDDYLLSKLPPDGRDVPFVLPTFRASYIQPSGAGLQSSARSTYAERKAELAGADHFTFNPESCLHPGQLTDYISPGSARRNTLKIQHLRGPGLTLTDGPQRLCSSMFDLSSPQSDMKRFSSSSSVFSGASSTKGSVESSLDSITLSGDEQDLGKVCVRLSYQEAVEQVWITLVQCSELSIPADGPDLQKIGVKGIITVPKPIQFKSSIKDCGQDVSFMETFVFALPLPLLLGRVLLLRLQTHRPKIRTVAECALSLRDLGPEEREHWLDLSPPSKSSVSHSELHLTTCFQPVNGRIQLQILAAQNLPPSASPLSQGFFVKAEMHQLGPVTKKKTRVLKASAGQCMWAETFHFHLVAFDQACSLSVKLYSRSSLRRKQCLGQIQLGLDSPAPEAVEQWKDTMAHPEKVVAVWHRLSH
ncbi:LOW QUALITY PROTEIN: tandem C2 domains nuclear protein [Neosynchiropus ocellatus]